MSGAQKIDLVSFLKVSGPITTDGAMATSLYEKGFYINRSFEELSLIEPKAVREVTHEFRRAGSQLFHTNTFSATAPKLAQYGLQDQLETILKKSCELAIEAAEGGYVLGLIGPLGVLIEPLGPTSLQEAEEYFARNIQTFNETDVDGIAIHAIHDFNELRAALNAAKKYAKKPLVVSIGVQENLKTSYGHTFEDFIALAKDYDIAALGICGEVGPSGMLSAVEELRPLTELPIMALPNAGMPRYVNDQYIYLCSPDYMGKYAKRLIQAGANIVGGHCGVYEAHIRAISNAIKMTSASAPAKDQKASQPAALSAVIKPLIDLPTAAKPLESRSLLGRYLKEKKRIYSVELVPPNLQDLDKFLTKCGELEKAGIDFVNIPDGARAMARVSSFQLSSYVRSHYRLEPIPHMTCRDRNLIGLQSDLLGAHVSGLRDILIVTGDPPKLGNNPGATAVYDVDAIGLTHIASRMNAGLDIGGVKSGARTEFVVGVALNPTAKNRELEIQRFKYKIEAGADFAITQPIYNLETFQSFLDEVGDIKIPIIMGLWPLVSLRNAEFLRNEVPGVDVPDWAVEEMRKAGDSKEEATKRGIEIAQKTLLEAEKIVAGFQISAPFNRTEVALAVMGKA
ncbi:MAG: bifunctional homocysteine S-methyltransferase/methylenetetrahydrofolate reductase [Bdellovibrionota bacterium]